ncbi:hypothetical protein [Streptomyces sp. NPDC058623]
MPTLKVAPWWAAQHGLLVLTTGQRADRMRSPLEGDEVASVDIRDV